MSDSEPDAGNSEAKSLQGNSSSQAPAPPPPPSLTPPTVQGALPVPRPKWPTVIGVIGLILGVLGVLGAVWGALAPFIVPALFGADSQIVTNSPALHGPWMPFAVAANLYGLGVSVMLIIGAMLLLRWRPSAVTAFRLWAVNSLIATVMGFAIAIGSALPQLEQAQAQMGGGSAFMMPMMVVFMLFGFAMSAAMPVFVLIWFSRAKVKADVVRWFVGGATRA